ncbi:hypothetical protein KKF61_08350, partial [Patescibacteria group bacterium]|nr:hypothetical protein [Patescibacteria group bacterium]
QMKAHAGRIGGWYIGTSTLSSTSITLDSVNDKITVGSSGLANINIDGENAKITVGNVGSTYIDIDGANTKIQSSDFVSGALGSGWRIDSNVGEFQNLRARGKFTTSIFEKDAISSIGGNLLVMPSDILDTDMTALDISTITILGDEIFAINDILRIKDGVDDEWFEVTSVSQTTYTVTRDKAGDYAADSNPIWTKGTAVVNYGASGEGGVFMTSSETDAPYIHFFTHAGSPWSATTAKCRIGNLNGITGCSGYGIWGGDGYLGQLEVIDIISITGQQGEIRSNSSGNYPYLSFSQGGLQLKDSDPGGTYGTAVYGTDKYGYGALVWILNTSLKIPWAELKEPNAGASDVASIRLYNRSDDPGGLAEVGDLAVVSGKLKICTGAGTPGTWTVVGSQTA